MTAQVMNVRRPPHDQGFALGTERCGCLGKHAGQGGHILEAHRCQWLSTPHINQRSGGVIQAYGTTAGSSHSP